MHSLQATLAIQSLSNIKLQEIASPKQTRFRLNTCIHLSIKVYINVVNILSDINHINRIQNIRILHQGGIVASVSDYSPLRNSTHSLTLLKHQLELLFPLVRDQNPVSLRI